MEKSIMDEIILDVIPKNQKYFTKEEVYKGVCRIAQPTQNILVTIQPALENLIEKGKIGELPVPGKRLYYFRS